VDVEEAGRVREHIGAAGTGEPFFYAELAPGGLRDLVVAAPNLAASVVALHTEVEELREQVERLQAEMEAAREALTAAQLEAAAHEAQVEVVEAEANARVATLFGPEALSQHLAVRNFTERVRGGAGRERRHPTIYIEATVTPRKQRPGYRAWIYLKGRCVGVSGLCKTKDSAKRQGTRMLIKLTGPAWHGQVA
jgi:outer membrane murein-binding lipoprotein Lpp